MNPEMFVAASITFCVSVLMVLPPLSKKIKKYNILYHKVVEKSTMKGFLRWLLQVKIMKLLRC